MACYVEFNINNDDTLQDFLRIPDEHMFVLVISMLEIYVKSEDVNKTDVPQTTANTQPSGDIFGAVLSE